MLQSPAGPGAGEKTQSLGAQGIPGVGWSHPVEILRRGRGGGGGVYPPHTNPGPPPPGRPQLRPHKRFCPPLRARNVRPLSWFCPSVGAHSVRPLNIGSRFLRRGGYYPPAVYHLRCMLLFSGADYLAEAPEQVIEQNGSDNVPTPFMRLPRRPHIPGYQKSAPGSGPAGGISHAIVPEYFRRAGLGPAPTEGDKTGRTGG